MAFPDDRPVGYDADAVFDESENDWADNLYDLETTGGERIKNQLVVLSDQGRLYFGVQ